MEKKLDYFYTCYNTYIFGPTKLSQLGFEEKWQLFVVKLANIAENIHHKNNPRGQFKKGGEAENSRLRCTGWVVIFFLYICTKACIKRPSDVARKNNLEAAEGVEEHGAALLGHEGAADDAAEGDVDDAVRRLVQELGDPVFRIQFLGRPAVDFINLFLVF
jgi:hypothetical protein